MEDAYIDGIYNHALKGYSASGRIADGEAFARKFTSDRKAEDLGRVKQSVDPGRYETKLTPDEEKGYQEWKKKNAPNDSGQDYDLRGAYKAGVEPDPQTGHMPDTYKKPNHPTFSNESQYSKDRPDLAGQWTGPNHDQFVPPAAGITAPPTGGQAQAAAAGPQSQLNQKRIDQINKNPEVKAAIEKAAADNNLDPNVLKVFASIEFERQPEGRDRRTQRSVQSEQGRIWHERRWQYPRCQRQCAGGSQGAGAETTAAHPDAGPPTYAN